MLRDLSNQKRCGMRFSRTLFSYQSCTGTMKLVQSKISQRLRKFASMQEFAFILMQSRPSAKCPSMFVRFLLICFRFPHIRFMDRRELGHSMFAREPDLLLSNEEVSTNSSCALAQRT